MSQQPSTQLSVLVVEDESSCRTGLCMALEPCCSKVIQADCGEAGLEAFRAHNPDVVITDVRMPRMSGLEMIRTLRGEGRDPFIIVASGFGAEECYLDAIELGVNLFVKKPYRLEQIHQALGRASTDIEKRRNDAYRRALSDGLLANVPNCHLLTDGARVLYFNDPQQILPRPCSEGEDVGFYMRSNFTQVLRHGAGLTSLPQSFDTWLKRHPGREFVLAANGQADKTLPKRLLLRLDPVRMDTSDSHLLTFTDISRIESERERFFHLAGRDFLTGVGNRQAFEAELGRETERVFRYGGELCLVMLDIDDFKSVNDTYGHQAGDRVLVELARKVGSWLRVTDVLCRYGGEEFMIVMPQTDLEGALSCSRKLSQAVATHDFGIGRKLTVSMGVAQHIPGETSQELIRRVDMALYDAKYSGKNTVCVGGEASPQA
ncbi:diguanylate cyclase [Fundidesulfovibrio agrisoli]|uniref:diguanylate cyclase n=1 Tax=Fundidesulfovibrio agrisoli TaxID=2922717 RepID=UPI001FAE6EBA|nr:diguanylate cyclase [Fundidesulfovibrio agrisoli]